VEIAMPRGPTLAAIPARGAATAPATSETATPETARDIRLRAAARDLEASFLAEMLRAAGFGKPMESFGGGAGEEQFASLLVTEHARVLAEQGGLGLSEHIYRALVERENATA
jgi:Rod binding domain-containing protein